MASLRPYNIASTVVHVVAIIIISAASLRSAPRCSLLPSWSGSRQDGEKPSVNLVLVAGGGGGGEGGMDL